MNYVETLEAIQSLAPRGWRLGLDRMEEFILRADLADAVRGAAKQSFIHVTGTNGKGSVTAYLQSMMVESGYRTGAFYSPFVFNPRERWQIGREMIEPEVLARIATQLWPIGESLSETDYGGVTEFEFKTALAFKFWQIKEVEWVALEVGLGGRLDATNVVTPKASVIVSIGLDHVNILGHTLNEIAFEKAGIVKRQVPLILGSVPPEARDTIEGVAADQEAPVWKFGRDIGLERSGTGWTIHTPARTYRDVRPGIPGHIQPHNAALAAAAMDASGSTRSEDAIVNGINGASIPGRFQRISARGREWILDGAHNAAAAEELRATLIEEGITTVILLTGMVAGHEPSEFYAPIKDLVKFAIFAPIQFHRALSPSEVSNQSGLPDFVCHTTLQEAIDEAVAREQSPILVTGSFYLLGEIAEHLCR